MSDGFSPGDVVSLKSDSGTTGVVTKTRDGSYEVMWSGSTTRFSWVEADNLTLQPRGQARFVEGETFLAFLALQKLAVHRFSDVLYAIGTSRTQFLVYQYQPVLKFVREAPHGLLIADEVGLGKTIEAALILKEMAARGPLERVLVVCPANLRTKWRTELQQRFGVVLRELKAADFREFRKQFEDTGRWPSFFGVASLEGLRSTDFSSVLQEVGVSMDLVIVDEAHHLRNPATRSFELGETLSQYADQIVLLSATPVQTSTNDLLSLLRLVAPTEFTSGNADELEARLAPNAYINAALRELSRPQPDLGRVVDHLRGVLRTPLADEFRANSLFNAGLELLDQSEHLPASTLVSLRADLQGLHTLAPYYVRTRKREVQEVSERVAVTKTVILGPEEEEFYEAWYAFLVDAAGNGQAGAGNAATWGVIQRERQAASSLPVAAAQIEDLIAAHAPSDVESNDPDSDSEGEQITSRPRLASPTSVARLRQAARGLGDTDSKLDDFLELIEGLVEAEPLRKILVFTFFRGTLAYLKRHLEALGVRVYSMSGNDRPDERAQIIEDFRQDAAARILVSTEVGSEGLDLQFCNAVVNYDLPWNPMRVEQRIGRIDRYGQVSPKVAVVSLYANGTIDTRILSRLYERIGVFEASIGELEPILGPEVRELQVAAFQQGLSPIELERQVEDGLRRIAEESRREREYESQRAELMGLGDIEREEIMAARASGRYVSSRETRALVEEWLGTIDRRSRVEPGRREGVVRLFLSDDAAARVRAWISSQDSRLRSEEAFALLSNIQEANRRLCTFESAVAQDFPTLPFLDTAHPVVRTALAELERGWDKDPMNYAGVFDGRNVIDTPSWLIVYRVGIHGVEASERLLPVAVSATSKQVTLEDGERLLGTLPLAASGSPDEIDVIMSAEEAERLAYTIAGAQRSDLEAELARTHSDRVNVRRASLVRQYATRIRQREATKERLVSLGRSPQVIRMKEGEIRNLQAEQDAKLAELDRLPAPSTDLEPIAYAYFDV